jgi:hypothetical protein
MICPHRLQHQFLFPKKNQTDRQHRLYVAIQANQRLELVAVRAHLRVCAQGIRRLE